MSSAIEAVVFDVGKVLVEWDLRHLFGKLIDDGQELEWFVANVISEEWHFQHDQGRMLVETIPERIAAYPQYETHIRAYAARYNETIPGPVAGSIELVERLAARGVPLYAITNFGEEFWAAFRPTMPVFDHFRDIVVSGTEKLFKPDPAIFDLAARRFEHDPAAMLFVDDNADNIAVARELGWQVHHFRDAATLERELGERGLLD